MNNRRSSFPPTNTDFRRSSFFPVNNGEFISPFTAPAVPNLSTQGVMLHKPIVAEAAFIPRSPLPPQKLAKLANALGISMPLPASSPLPSDSRKTFSTPRSEELTSPESKISKPASAGGSSTSSRYLIHVIPPKRFPHESRKQDPEAFAAFQRGSLVPLHATLQAQISAIAREYQLPTTHGIVLYLVDERETDSPSRRVLGKGPRIGEDVWRWLWAKVGEEQPITRAIGLGFSNGTTPPTPSERPLLLRKRSSPTRLDLQRVAPPPTINFPLTPSPSTPSTDKSTNTPPDAKQEDFNVTNSSLVQSNPPQYPSSSSNLSAEDQYVGQDLDARLLPGLGSPSLIPVLAKIEFDIDRRIGTWYDAWCRSRKSKHKHKTRKVDAQGKVRLQIMLNDKQGPIDQSSSSESSSSESEGEAEYARLSDASDRPDGHRKDPLADVFGSDGETWSKLQSGRHSGKTKGGLALDGASLSTPFEQDDHEHSGASEDEVVALWNARNQSHLQRVKVPAPLNLGSDARNIGIDASIVNSSSTNGGDSTLPYLTDKRAGGIYDDLELDLEDIDIEEHRAKQLKMMEELDILEQKMTQLSPRALKSVDLLSDLSALDGPLLRSAPPHQSGFSSNTTHAHHAGSQSVELASGWQGGLNSSTSGNTIGPPVFKQPVLVGTPSPDVDSFKGPQGPATGSDGNVMYDTPELAAWPAVPHSTIISRDPTQSPTTSMKSLKTGKHPNSPPKVVLNGPVADKKRKNSSISSMLSNISGPPREASESRARMKQYEEEAAFYADTPKLQPSLTRRIPESNGSPVLPLSPDPFGRFPSMVDGRGSSNVSNPPGRTTSLARDPHSGQDTSRHSLSSRFSIDSVADEQPSSKVSKGNGLVSMKSLRKLWRKSDKSGNSGTPIPSSPDPSTLPSHPTSTVAFMRDTEMDISRTPSPSVQIPSGSTRNSQKPSRSQRDSGLDPFYFDQDTKFASRKTPSPSPQMAYQFPRNGTQQGQAPGPGQTPTAEKKRSVRKSLVNKWKNGSEGSSSTDSGSDQRRRRPSVLDVSGLMRRNGGNGSISSASILNSPSVPDIPAEYRMSQHSRIQSRGSISTMLTSMTSNIADDRVLARRKPTTQSSTDSSQESVDPLPTPVSGVSPLSFATLGKDGKGSMSGSVTLSLASPGEASDGMRSSFDDSQFEMLTPPPNVGQKFSRPSEMGREART